MIPRDEALNKLKEHWETDEFTFLARYDLARKYLNSDDPRAFGFFNEIFFNQKRLDLPVNNENEEQSYASCYAKKNDLQHNSFYIIKAKLNEEKQRVKKEYGLFLDHARLATPEEVKKHCPQNYLENRTLRKRKSKSDIKVGYVNFLADDYSHAYITIVEETTNRGINRVAGERGIILHKFPKSIKKRQIILVRGTKTSRSLKFVDLFFRGHLINNEHFVDIDSSEFAITIESISSSLPNLLDDLDKKDELKEDIIPIKVCLEHRSGKIEYTTVSNIEEELKLSSFESYIDENIRYIHSDSRPDFTSLLKIATKNIDGIKDKLIEQFEKEIKENKLTTESIINWSSLLPEKIKESSFQNQVLEAESLWIQGKLPHDYFEDNLVTKIVTHFTKTDDSIYSVFQSLNPSQKTELKTRIEKFVRQGKTFDNFEEFTTCEKLIELSFPNQLLLESEIELFRESASEETKFRLWRAGELSEIPIDIVLQNFDELEIEEQENIIPKLSDNKFEQIIGLIKSNENTEINERINKILRESITKKLNPICFDIESNQESIHEIAWGNGIDWNTFENENVKEGLLSFRQVLGNDNLLIGHNITKFDIPILDKKLSFPFSNELIWDTLMVEKVLSPELQNLALKTSHKAIEDTELTFQLFENQLFRILASFENNFEKLTPLFSDDIIIQLTILSNELEFTIDVDLYNRKKVDFFRPQPTVNSIVGELIEKLKEEQEESETNPYVLGPPSIAPDLLKFGEIVFCNKSSDLKDYKIINEELVNNSLILNKFQKLSLQQYIGYCIKNTHIPYWGNVSISLKLEIEEHCDVWNFIENDDDYSQRYPKFITTEEFESLSSENYDFSNTKVFVIQPNLISVSQKILIKELETAELMTTQRSNFFWMKFSGGQSIVSLEKDEVWKIGIQDVEEFQHFWIEKYKFNNYRVYGNKNWENDLKKLNFFNRENIELDSKKFTNDKVFCIKFNKDNVITRFNPESIYRSRYWTIQNKIIDQITINGSSIILIQRREEIIQLEELYENLGFYIPSKKATVARRLELLHESAKNKKIIIAHISEAENIITSNHKQKINLIIDSFNLTDSFYCSQGTAFFNKSMSEGMLKKGAPKDETENNIEISSSQNKSDFIKDYFFLLKLLKPKIDQIRNTLFLNDPENTLWILDPRIEDFNELNKSWNINKRSFYGWESKELFNESLKETEKIITSPTPDQLPFGIKESMEIIRKIFIPDHPWKEEQKPYLENILESNNDLLITLPTGVGKSVLFQGPALLKSTFSNKLSIVVTPLKALMEDHALGLWTKGFFSNVDYLNSDRSSDTELIYRSIAGGEMSLVFVTPERFRSKGFLRSIETRIETDGGLEYFVFDEAHCVSQWGHDFRPDYFNCAKYVNKIKSSSKLTTPLLLFSATVSEMIYEDFQRIFR